jgi:two-component system OmpR family response regulator
MAEKRRIMVVEDEPSTLNLLAQIVMRAGYEPVPVRGGREAIRLLQETKADLILLDLMLRDLDGWTVLMTIKADPRSSSIPIIIVSAKTPAEHPIEMEALMDYYEDYFVKPFELNVLVARIAEILQP